MGVADKILKLRKQSGMSQEELAEKLNVSRQTISRWEIGSAQPDATNLLQLSRIFGVTADYIINNEYNNDRDIPVVKNIEASAKRRITQVIGMCIAVIGIAGNVIIYVLSRIIDVIIPYTTKNGEGKTIYNWSGDFKGHSYRYFIQQYDLEILTVFLYLLMIVGVFIVFMNKQKIREYTMMVMTKMRKKDNLKIEVFNKKRSA